jgi:hypothetical protein
MVNELLIALFIAAFLLDFAAFGMQRATLLMSREAELPSRIGALLLPAWFPAVWLVRIAKWGALVAIAVSWSWVIAIGLLLADVVLSAVLPIPYRAYIPSFRSRIVEIKRVDLRVGNALESMLNASKIHGS